MRLKTVEITNVFSVGHMHLDLHQQGLVLVTGYSEDEGSSNGAGKSNTANKAILWGLFGQTAGGIRADDIINRHQSKSGPSRVEIFFEGVDNRLYRLVRSRNPNKLELYVDINTRLTKRLERETQVLIDRALGRDISTFTQTDFFGQGNTKNYAALAPREQKEVLEQILPIEQLSVWSDRTRKYKSTVGARLEDANKDLAKLDGRLEELGRVVADVSRKGIAWGTQIKKDIASLEVNLQQADNEADARRTVMWKLREELLALKAPVIPREAEIRGAQDKVREASETLLKAGQSRDRWYQKLAVVSSDIKHIENLPEGYCSTCEQMVGHEAKKDREYKLGILKTTQAPLIETMRQANDAKAYWELECVRRNDDYSEKQAQHRDGVVHQEKEKGLKSHLASLQKIDEGSDCKILRAQILALNNQANPYNQQARDISRDIDQLFALKSEKLEYVGELRLDITNLSFWLDAFTKNLKNLLLARACPFLDQRTARHLQGLGNPQLKVSFSTTKLLKRGDTTEDFNVSVESSTGGKGFESLSGGEQQMTSFAIGLALADLAETQVEGSSHFLILDEPFMALDGRNCENIVNYLNDELSKKRETILLISNEDSLQSLIPNRIHVVKTGGVTDLGKIGVTHDEV